MRTLILSPVDRRKILLGKNIAMTLIAIVFYRRPAGSQHDCFRGHHRASLLFVSLCFIIFAALMSTIGNWLSIRFPKRMMFGKRMNVSGVAGLLLIPIIIVLGIPPLAGHARRLFHAELCGLNMWRSRCWPWFALAFTCCISEFSRPHACATRDRNPRSRARTDGRIKSDANKCATLAASGYSEKS